MTDDPPPPPIEPGTTFDLFRRAAERAEGREDVWPVDITVLAADGFDLRRYGASPTNARPFADMGVDGVHWTLLALDGAVRENSPVLQVSPTDGPDALSVEARSFLDHVCGVTGPIWDRLLTAPDRERAGEDVLAAHLPELRRDLGRLTFLALRGRTDLGPPRVPPLTAAEVAASLDRVEGVPPSYRRPDPATERD